MSTALAIAIAAVALACPLHMLWRMRRGRRGCCAPAREAPVAELRERQRALAQRVLSLTDARARRESERARH